MVINRWTGVYAFAAALLCSSWPAAAATIYVPAGGDLQQALNAAQPGDTIMLEENAEFVGNFVLPVKPGEQWITVRTAAPDPVLPPAGVRIQPAHASLLARLRSPNSNAALRTAPGAHHWDIRFLEFPANLYGAGDVIQLGDGSSAQNSLAQVPHHIVLNHVYVHGHPLYGQKRGIALNAAFVTISDSYIADCKGVGQDTQAIGGWNGPGPYVIENNYLEGAGENVLFGGADPAIPNLVADGITFRRNYLSRPMAWRNPIIPAPQGVTAAATAEGSLPAGVYGYRVIARRPVGPTVTGRSSASAEVTVTTTEVGAVRVQWQPVDGAAEYRVYGRTPAAEAVYWTVTATEFIDTGATGTSEAVPTSAGTVWSVKNIFELKNARNVVVEHNIFENHWKESQPGFSIVLTPRNSNGTCTWCVVENVRFTQNIVRNVAAGINLLGYDAASRPTRQSTNITFEQNLFTGMSTALGGNGWFLQIGDEPRNVTLAHNTIDSNGNAVVYTYGGSATSPRKIYGFQMIANAARHGSYGMNGANFGYGNAIINGYYPDAVFASNYLAGASASRYPTGTLVAGLFQNQFVDVAAGDYTVRADSILKGAAPDGSDVGAGFPALMTALEGVQAGIGPLVPAGDPTPVPATVDFTSSCSFLECTFTDASVAGTTPLVAKAWSFGDGPDTSAGSPATHVFAAAGSYTVSLTVTDANGLGTSVSKTIAVEAPIAPTAALSVSCTYLVCNYADASTAGSGAITSWSWTFGDGSPALPGPGGGAHVFAAAGTYALTLMVTDDNGLASSATTTVTVEPPNVAPVAAFTASCIDLSCTFADRSTDTDGTIVAWAWTFPSGASTVAAPTFTFAAPGFHEVTLTVADDDGAMHTVVIPVEVTGRLHTAYSGSTLKWSNKSGSTWYWSADVTAAVHGLNERPIAGAIVTAVWSGALVKTVTCVTAVNGRCTFKSGTLSYGRGTVTLKVTSVVAPGSVYDASANHDQAGMVTPSLTLIRP